jgi:diguanylate cyclase (GGDEF)-like protein/PAS domain S-box-containing protein
MSTSARLKQARQATILQPQGAAATDSGSREDTAPTQQQLFDTILSNLSQGVLMFDKKARVVFCNRRYIEMYGLSPKIAKPGCGLRVLLNHRIAVQSFSGDVKRYMSNLLAAVRDGKEFNQIARLDDGRVFSVLNKPLPGGGWLATHEDITEREHAQEQIARMARHDALTDLPNRVLLRERLEGEIRRTKRGECVAVLCLDLDHFKGINDTLGHPVGDELLKVVADRLRRCVREPDTIARLGGDEFAIIMTAMQQPTDAVALATRVQKSITKPYQLNDHQVVVDVSIGISVAPLDADQPDQLLKNADMALYEAKAQGRGAYRFFEQEMDARMQARRELEIELRKALINNEFELYYQPLIDLRNKAITAFEALLRWHHPSRGLISPAEFVPVAEDTGLIISLGEWVLRKACEEAATWPGNVKLAVNLSPTQLKNPNLVQVIMSALAASGIPGSRLQLEITESVLMQNTFATLATLHRLRALGIQIAMDDFGTGYSSLSYLRSFPFDKIKIDRAFVRDLSNGTEPVAIVQAMTQLADCLNMICTAEGGRNGTSIAETARDRLHRDTRLPV